MDELLRQATTILLGMWKRRWLGIVIAWIVGVASVAAVSYTHLTLPTSDLV